MYSVYMSEQVLCMCIFVGNIRVYVLCIENMWYTYVCMKPSQKITQLDEWQLHFAKKKLRS